MTQEARGRWLRKLDYLLAQEPVLAAPAQMFELREQIDECRAKLGEFPVTHSGGACTAG